MTKINKKTTRRTFINQTGMLSAGITLGLNPIMASKKPAPSDKIRVGFIGVGNRGSQLLKAFMTMPDCEVAALCDVYEPYITRDRSKVDPRYLATLPGQVPKMDEVFPTKVERYTDYRKLLENKNIDAVCIATPDHWHAIMTIQAIQAGKDVYIEKPLSKTLTEGRAMINAWKNSKQIVTVGLNRRASTNFQNLAREVPAGKIGKVTFANSCYVGNMFPNGIGKLKPENPPKDLNWDLWLGPRAFIPYQYNIAPYMFRWWDDYSSQIGNNGVHYLDLMRWMLNEQAPLSISASGGKYAVDDDRTIPDTMQVTYEFGSGALMSINILEASAGSFVPYGFIEMRGTKGTLYTGENDYKIVPTRPGQFQKWDKLMDAEEKNLETTEKLLSDGSNRDSTTNLIRNFLDCIKSRKAPFCTLEEGHRSASLAHLANISLATKQRLQWDPVKERITNYEKGNELLGYEYRKPWSL